MNDLSSQSGRIIHALVYHGIGPCEGCGKRDGSFRHATYKYVKDEKREVTVQIPQLWCSEKCCIVCREEKEKEKRKEANCV